MARSTTRSNQRPDTLMQDRICQVDETSCNARPDHTSGSKAPFCLGTNHFRSTPINRHSQRASPCLKRANTGIRTVCVSDWLRPRGHQLGWYHNAARGRCPSCCTFSGTLFISIYPHIPSLIFWTDAGSPIPENACAERRKADFGGYPVAFATFCVDGMKFALRC